MTWQDEKSARRKWLRAQCFSDPPASSTLAGSPTRRGSAWGPRPSRTRTRLSCRCPRGVDGTAHTRNEKEKSRLPFRGRKRGKKLEREDAQGTRPAPRGGALAHRRDDEIVVEGVLEPSADPDSLARRRDERGASTPTAGIARSFFPVPVRRAPAWTANAGRRCCRARRATDDATNLLRSPPPTLTHTHLPITETRVRPVQEHHARGAERQLPPPHQRRRAQGA